MNRGARREPLFFDDAHCVAFLDLVAELPERYGVLVHAYALMPNHFHLLVESIRGQLSRAMGFLGSRYAAWLNRRHPGWDGPVYKGRYHSRPVFVEEHWHHLPIYLHLNPVRAGIVPCVDQSRWTSHGAYAGTEAVPDWLTTADLLSGYGSTEGYRAAQREVELKRAGAPDGFEKALFAPYTRAARKLSGPRPTTGRSAAPTAEAVLEAVAQECEVERAQLTEVRLGRHGNLAKKVGAYWLAVGAGLPNKEVAALLDLHHVRVSQSIKSLRKKTAIDPDLAQLMARLRRRLLREKD